MSRAIIHIGPHKTGTTYIQSMLTANGEALAKEGVRYAVEDDPSGFAHHELAELLKTNKFDAGAVASRLQPHGAETVVLSSENFSRLSKEEWDRFLELLSHEYSQIDVIAYLRSKSDVLYSWWQERVKFGFSHSFPHFLAQALMKPYANPQINLAHLLGRIDRTKLKTLSIVSYDGLVASSSDLFSDFLTEVLSLPADKFSFTGKKINQSIEIKTLEILRGLNFLYEARRKRPATVKLRSSFLNRQETDPKFREITKSMSKRIEPLLCTIDVQPIDENYAFLDQALAKNFPGCVRGSIWKDSAQFYPDRDANLKPFLDGRHLLKADFRKDLEGLF
ncbi:MAG: hypothetical protein RLN72_03730, partial [Henriciella sp.]